MSFIEIFTSYWDMAITGFIGGIIAYLMHGWGKKIKNKFILTCVIFSMIMLLVFLYSFVVWLFSLYW